MYTLIELNSKSDSELVSIAEGMGLKKIDVSKKDELIYRILDQQAEIAAVAVPEKKSKSTKDKTKKADKPAKAAAEKAAIDKALPNLSQKQRNALYEAFK